MSSSLSIPSSSVGGLRDGEVMKICGGGGGGIAGK